MQKWEDFARARTRALFVAACVLASVLLSYLTYGETI
jgi:hypothetical protein